MWFFILCGGLIVYAVIGLYTEYRHAILTDRSAKSSCSTCSMPR